MWTGRVTAGISIDEVIMVDDDQFIKLWKHYENDTNLTDELIDGLNQIESKVVIILT